MIQPVDAWQQVRAGRALIEWSKLASWDDSNVNFVASAQASFEAEAVQRHADFGRVIAWVIFAVGCEYVLKGACVVRGLTVGKAKVVLRPPAAGEDVAQWAALALANDSSVREEVISTGALGELPIAQLVANLPGQDLARAAFDLLRQSMRNRDAHQYVSNVRAAHFAAVSELFVPALNVVLRSLDQAELRSRLSESAA